MKITVTVLALFGALYWQVIADTLERGAPEPWRPGVEVRR